MVPVSRSGKFVSATGYFPGPRGRPLLLTLAVGAGLIAYVTGAVRSIYNFDLAMLLALIGGFPTYAGAAAGLLHAQAYRRPGGQPGGHGGPLGSDGAGPTRQPGFSSRPK